MIAHYLIKTAGNDKYNKPIDHFQEITPFQIMSMKRIKVSLIAAYALCMTKIFYGLLIPTIDTFENDLREYQKTRGRMIRNKILFYHRVRNILWPVEPIHVEWHPSSRDQRFPSIERRVEIYMGYWYNLPNRSSKPFEYMLDDTGDIILHSHIAAQYNSPERLAIRKELILHSPIFFHEEMCKYATSTILNYCEDATLRLLRVQQRLPNEELKAPVVTVFGDATLAYPFPTFSKFRLSTLAEETMVLADKGPMSIISNFNSDRHFGKLGIIRKCDTPWYLKKNEAVWRGAMTGGLTKEIDEASYYTDAEDEINCIRNHRCHFVLENSGSTLMDVGLTNDALRLSSPEAHVYGMQVVKDKYTIKEMLEFKIIISLEGNDVSSGLKWQLLCKSVVLMPPPSFTSWAMEELLQPWVHYVPIEADGSDAVKKTRWVIENEDEALKISERATLFMEDMIYHPEAATDESLVLEEIMRRYENLWHNIDAKL